LKKCAIVISHLTDSGWRCGLCLPRSMVSLVDDALPLCRTLLVRRVHRRRLRLDARHENNREKATKY
jgi:hypothetical protein